MIAKAVVACLISSTLLLQAAPRLRNSSGDSQRAIQQAFIQRDATTVTLRQPNGKPVTTPIDQLSADDRTWLNQAHPLACATLPPQTAVFDQLLFGDTRAQVLAKLKASQFVELAVDETFIGRTGLNGVFRTRKKIGGLNASLYFAWTATGELSELTLQTETLPESAYRTVLQPSWQEFIPLLTTLYGKPVQKGPFPRMEAVADGMLSPTHLWSLEGVGSALLGTARSGDKYQIVVRFTQKQIQPVYMPEPQPGI